jgi:hypothetical protein
MEECCTFVLLNFILIIQMSYISMHTHTAYTHTHPQHQMSCIASQAGSRTLCYRQMVILHESANVNTGKSK